MARCGCFGGSKKRVKRTKMTAEQKQIIRNKRLKALRVKIKRRGGI